MMDAALARRLDTVSIYVFLSIMRRFKRAPRGHKVSAIIPHVGAEECAGDRGADPNAKAVSCY